MGCSLVQNLIFLVPQLILVKKVGILEPYITPLNVHDSSKFTCIADTSRFKVNLESTRR